MAGLRLLWATRWRAQVVFALAAVAAGLIGSTGLIGWQISQRSEAALEREAEAAAWDARSVVAERLASTRGSLPAHIQHVAALRAAGFGRPVDRVAWAERTIEQLESLRPIGYSVELEPAGSLPLPESLQSAFLDRGDEPPPYVTNDLVLKVQGLHEVELVEVVEAATVAGEGVVRVEHCRLQRRADGIGLDAECRLRRFSLPLAGAEPVS